MKAHTNIPQRGPVPKRPQDTDQGTWCWVEIYQEFQNRKPNHRTRPVNRRHPRACSALGLCQPPRLTGGTSTDMLPAFSDILAGGGKIMAKSAGRVDEDDWWGGRRDLNPRQPDPQSGALTRLSYDHQHSFPRYFFGTNESSCQEERS